MERIYHFKNSRIRVIFGDITQCSTEVIVSSVDDYLTMGGGVSAMIGRCAGNSIVMEAQKHVPAKLGDVVVTGAGNLLSKYIFHVVTIGVKRLYFRLPNEDMPNSKTNRYIIENSINKCFRLLASLDLTSIAFPAIGAGVAGIPYEEVASHMIRSIATNLERTNKTINVELYLYDRYHKMSEWDFLPFFEKIGKYLSDEPSESRMVNENEHKIDDDIVNQDSNIFISYSRKDQEQASAICELLNKNDIPYWIDNEGKYSGSNFKGVIVEQIKKSGIILFLSSQNSNQSSNVVKEIGLAVHYSKPIIPIKLDAYSYNVNIEYDLCNIDYMEYDGGEAFEHRLMDTIRGYL